MAVVDTVTAGDPPTDEPALANLRTAVRVATGALMPPGYDTVLPLETVSDAGDTITYASPPASPVAAGANVRRTGEDHRPGDVVLAAGRRVEPEHVLLLANVGCAEITVARRPRVAVLATGSEVVADPSVPLRPGQVRNSNARYLVSALTAAGCEVHAPGIVPDHPDTVRSAIERALGRQPVLDLIVTVGGVSRGEADFVPAALAALGADNLFHGVALRPGKPVLCTRLPGWRGLLFGLPGNPLAVLATFRTLVVPCLRVLQGQPPEPRVAAVLGAPVRGRPPLTRLVLARGVLSRAGGESVVPVGGQKASQVSALQSADRWLLIPPDQEQVPAGACATTLSL
jgi:molybdopterin molybdotransferase